MLVKFLEHEVDEVSIGLGAGEIFDNLFGDIHDIARAHGAAQQIHNLILCIAEEQVLAASSGFVQVDCREYAALGQLPVEVQLHIARALEFLVDNVVHARAGLDQRGSEYGYAAAFLDLYKRNAKRLEQAEKKKEQRKEKAIAINLAKRMEAEAAKEQAETSTEAEPLTV